MSIRLKIAQYIKENNLSVNALSKQSGVRRQSISHFLAGRNLHLKNLENILEALGYELSLNKVNKKSDLDQKSLFQKRVSVSKKQIAKFCKENKIKYMAVFGSVLTKDFNKNSDIDVMIELEKPISYFEFMDLELKIKKLFSSDHELDVVTVSSVSPLIQKEIQKNKEVLYEKAA